MVLYWPLVALTGARHMCSLFGQEAKEEGSYSPPICPTNPVLPPTNPHFPPLAFHPPRASLSSWPGDTERFHTHQIQYHFGTPPKGNTVPSTTLCDATDKRPSWEKEPGVTSNRGLIIRRGRSTCVSNRAWRPFEWSPISGDVLGGVARIGGIGFG
jgi:hypothetical protein